MLISDPCVHLFRYKPGIQLFSTGSFCSQDRLGSWEAEAKCRSPSRPQLAASKSHATTSFSATELERSPMELSAAWLTEVHECRGAGCAKKQLLHFLPFPGALKSGCNPAGLPKRSSLIPSPPSLLWDTIAGFVTRAGGQTGPCPRPAVLWKERMVGNRQLELFQECMHFLGLSNPGISGEAPGQLGWLCPQLQTCGGRGAAHIWGPARSRCASTGNMYPQGTVWVTPCRKPQTTSKSATAGRGD